MPRKSKIKGASVTPVVDWSACKIAGRNAASRPRRPYRSYNAIEVELEQR
jgi:hypothetical protein